MKSYELAIVLDGKATAAKKKQVKERIESFISAAKGKLGKVDEWGAIDLYYKIKKSDKGIFMFFQLELPASAVKSLSEKVKLDSDIIRYLLLSK